MLNGLALSRYCIEFFVVGMNLAFCDAVLSRKS